MIRIFIYNIVPLKTDFDRLNKLLGGKFILIASDYVINLLSDNNRTIFETIYTITRNFHEASYREIKPIITELIERFEIEDISLLTNEDSTQLTCARLRQEFGIAGVSTAQVLPFVDKTVSKQQLTSIIKLPKYFIFDKTDYSSNPNRYIEKISQYLSFPMLAKPVDLVSSIGVKKISTINELKLAAAMIMQSPYTYEIDEFIEGTLYHCDLIVIDKVIKFGEVGIYINHLAEFAKGKPMGSMPLTVRDPLKTRIIETSQLIIDKLASFSSAFHFEFFVNQKNEIIFLEAAARMPGVLLTNIYEKMYDINLEEMHYLAQLKPEHSQLNRILIKKCHAGWVSYPSCKGQVTAIKTPEISINNQINKNTTIGCQLKPAVSLLDSIYSIIFYDENYANVAHTFDYLKTFQPVIIKT